MWILIIYILIVVVGESVVVGIGLVLDRTFPLASLPVSLTLSSLCWRLDGLLQCVGPSLSTQRE